MNDYNIKQLYEDMEIELISSMKRNYKRHLKEEKKTGFEYSQWQAEKLKELKDITKKIKILLVVILRVYQMRYQNICKKSLNKVQSMLLISITKL